MLRQRGGPSGYPTNNDYYGGYSGAASPNYGGYQQGGNTYNAPSYGGYQGGNNAYGSAAQSSSSGEKYSRRRSNPSMALGGGAMNPMAILSITLGLFALVMLLLWNSARSRYNSILEELNVPTSKAALDLYQSLQTDLEVARSSKNRINRDTDRKYVKQQKELEAENRKLQKERDALTSKYESPERREQDARLLAREEAFQAQVERLQTATRRESKRAVLERFGPGPHEVEFNIMLNEKLQQFVVELAPVDDVPHAVHLFLEQVSHGLWNECYFYLNGPHVIQAGPRLLDEDEDAPAPEHVDDDGRSHIFQSAGLDKLAFPDYSPNFPHDPWTLGFTGRPGGPDFYINKVDNKASHGPGGQDHHALDEQGDSCFAKIVRGKEVVAELFSAPIYNDHTDWHYFVEHPVDIVEARILTKTPMNPEVNASVEGQATHTYQDHEQERLQHINDKLNRKPRLPHIDQAAVP
eukprot:Nitzschia sp. Nitz4//scaffold325_size20118//9160//10704//NITZ4_008702-RA/size20118-snap-gene-0.33-mRNA-1//-1//CDS//3329547899//7463//frame0